MGMKLQALSLELILEDLGLLHPLQYTFCGSQGGITCGAIDEPRKSSKVIDERVIINFCDKNVVNARFCDKNVFFYLLAFLFY